MVTADPEPAGHRYERIGSGYAAARPPDPRIGGQLGDAIGAAPTVVNCGAGTGNVETDDRPVVGVGAGAK